MENFSGYYGYVCILRTERKEMETEMERWRDGEIERKIEMEIEMDGMYEEGDGE
jgi:hypothetical protein